MVGVTFSVSTIVATTESTCITFQVPMRTQKCNIKEIAQVKDDIVNALSRIKCYKMNSSDIFHLDFIANAHLLHGKVVLGF